MQTQTLETLATHALAGDGARYPGAIILAKITGPTPTPFATFLEVRPDGRDARGTAPYRVRGHYFAAEAEAREDFAERCKQGA